MDLFVYYDSLIWVDSIGQVEQGIDCYKYSNIDITMSAEEHVEPAVIPRARSLVYFPSLQDCRTKDATMRTLAGSKYYGSKYDVQLCYLVSYFC